MYPTRRMIFVALAGIPLSLLAAMVSPPLWLLGVAWILFCVCLLLLDAVLAADPSGLDFALALPGALGVARAENTTVTLSFARSAPATLQFAVGTNEKLRVIPEQQTCTVAANRAEADFALEPVRRGEGVVEALWARWQGPLGLCWKQRHDSIDRRVAILPNIATVK